VAQKRLWIQKVLHSKDELPRTSDELFWAAGFEIVDDTKNADYGIINHMWGDHYFAPLPRKRVVALYDEPPAICHVPLYRNPGSFHTWFTFSPMTGENVFQLTEDPIVYPYPPETWRDRTRRDTTLKTRGVFARFTTRREYAPSATEFGSVPLYVVRNQFLCDLSQCGTLLDCTGAGIGAKGTPLEDWPTIKRISLAVTQADFCFCSENCMMDNYITEKIHHAMQRDVVALYLGSPRIEEFVPPGSFINLNRFFSRSDNRVDARAVHELLQGITQDEYDHILHTARSWRRNDMLEERHIDARDRITLAVISRLNEDYQ
jgi:hypothetical protein